MLPNEQEAVTDEDVERVLSTLKQGATKKEAEKKRRSLSKEELHKLRVRAKFDLFFLSYGILGNNRLSPNLHGNLCTHIVNTQESRFREFLLPRGNFKTTIITIADSIRAALPCTEKDLEYNGWWLGKDEKVINLTWPYSLGTDIRLLIGHETAESASRFLFSITNHITSNTLLMALFPEIVPEPRTHRINKRELELPRTITGNPEPTFDTIGVDGKSQGRHYNYIKLDDIFGDKARDSETESQTTKNWFDNIQAFFSLFSKDHLDLTGTRYSHDDIYGHAHEMYGNQLVKYIRKLEERNPVTGEVEITFPEEFTQESIQIIKRNKKIYAAQYQNDPEDTTGGFDEEWLQYFNWIGIDRIVVFSGNEREVLSVRDLDISVLIDPGESKSGGFCVTGMDHKRRVFILVALRLELTTPDLTDLVFKTVIRWLPRTVAIETDFFMHVFVHWWQSLMQVRKVYFNITPVRTKLKAKDKRIEGLTNYFENRQIFCNIAQEDFISEYKRWKKSKDIHILDALAYGPEVWRQGWAPGTRMENPATVTQEDDRDIQTGYSN